MMFGITLAQIEVGDKVTYRSLTGLTETLVVEEVVPMQGVKGAGRFVRTVEITSVVK